MTRSILILCALFFAGISIAQKPFEGIIDMTTVNNEIQEKADIKWYIKNGNHRLEYSGTKAGESYSYIFLIAAGNNLMQMLSDADGKKVVYEIPQDAITNSIKPGYGSEIQKTDDTKLVSGYSAIKMKVESPDKISTVWVSDKTPINMHDMPAILLSSSVLKNLKEKGINAIPLEINSTNTGGNLLYSQKITSIKKQSVSDDKFKVPAEYQPLNKNMQVQPADPNQMQNSNPKGN
ncbi:MAG: DUF4412 domain-containing protein [Chitinophagales bacterium]